MSSIAQRASGSRARVEKRRSRRRFLRPLLSSETRRPEEIIEHYEVEIELADRLRQALDDERPTLYSEVYDELFRSLPHHPQLTRKESDEEREARAEQQLGLLARFLHRSSHLMEIGAGDCSLSLLASEQCRKVTAVDVSTVVTEQDSWPDNVRFKLTDGTQMPVVPGSVDVAYSDQLMEHLHENDARAQLDSIFQSLRSGGCYVCVTPNQVAGPWDVSMYFDETARGLHLREYRAGELVDRFTAAGFSRVEFYAGGRGHYFRVPRLLVKAAERALLALPYGLRSRVALTLPMRGLLGIRAVAWKDR